MGEASVISRIARAKVVPVVVLERAEDAVPLARALIAGGIDIAEVTFRTDAAAEAIRAIADEVPDMLVGAGTVTRTEQLDQAVAAGARFALTPGFNAKVVAHAQHLGLPIVPGVNAPSGVEQALDCGLDTVKFFPAGPSGGTAFLKAVSGPYPEMRYIPTGGVNAANLRDYLALPSVIACGGSWMVDPALIAQGKFPEITRLAAEAVATVQAETV